MASINIELDYFEHFKTKRLISKLGQHADSMPIKLWICAARFSPKTGLFKGLGESELLNLAGITHKIEEAGHICSVLIEVGFLEKTRWGLSLHDWKAHQGHIIAFKIRAQQAAKKRWDNIKAKEKKPMNEKEFKEAWKIPSTPKIS